MKDLGKSQYSPVGYCIYCGEEKNLSKEHIVPFGLSGSAVLPKASCSSCTQKTKKFEEEILRGPLWSVRVFRHLKSRRKHSEAPRLYPLTVMKDGKEETIELPIEEYPILLHFPEFPRPAYLEASDYKSGISLKGVTTISFGPQPDSVLRQIDAQNIQIKQKWKPVSFARMIAKIAYCYAFAEGALSAIKTKSSVLPAILGQQDDIGKWVGQIDDRIKKYESLLHRIAIHNDLEKGLLIGEVQLFADSETPCYGVILGDIN
jgi:hypothetical protein